MTQDTKREALIDQGCRLPPDGWHCTRALGHEGPCAAHKVDRPVGAGWSPIPTEEANHAERLTSAELDAVGLGLSDWARQHLARGYAVSLTVREVKRLIAALSTHPAPTAEQGGWMPIETAPRDGTSILAFSADYGVRETKMGRYGKGSPGYAKWESGDGPLNHGWEWSEPKSNVAHYWNPTHWMPLPTPPATLTKSNGDPA